MVSRRRRFTTQRTDIENTPDKKYPESTSESTSRSRKCLQMALNSPLRNIQLGNSPKTPKSAKSPKKIRDSPKTPKNSRSSENCQIFSSPILNFNLSEDENSGTDEIIPPSETEIRRKNKIDGNSSFMDLIRLRYPEKKNSNSSPKTPKNPKTPGSVGVEVLPLRKSPRKSLIFNAKQLNKLVAPQFRPSLPTSARKALPKSEIAVDSIVKSSFYNQVRIVEDESDEEEISFPNLNNSKNYENPPTNTSNIIVRPNKNKITPTRKTSRINKSRVIKRGNKKSSFGGGIGHGISKPKKLTKKQILKLKLRKHRDEIRKQKSEIREIREIEKDIKNETKFLYKEIVNKTTNGSVGSSSKVSFEIRGGQMVFRKAPAKPEISTPPPIRRSPRKHQQPIGGTPNHSNRKLFSPSNSFLKPTSPNKSICPSPVKFDKEEEVHVDVSNLIDDLEDEDAGNGNAVYVTEEELNKIAIETEEQIRNLNPFQIDEKDEENRRNELNSNIRDILSAMPFTSGAAAASGEMEMETENEMFFTSEEIASTNEVFPIFTNPKTGLENKTPEINTNKNIIKKKKFIGGLDDEGSLVQTIIDAGQAKIGPQYCLTCSTIYTLGDPDDERHHEKIHNGVMDVVKFNRWKHEDIVRHLPDIGERVIKVNCHNMKSWEKTKINQLIELVDSSLGSVTNLDNLVNPTAYLYIADKMVAGFLLAEKISKAYPMNEDLNTCNMDKVADVSFGVSRIWVMPEYRKRKIASILTDTARQTFSGFMSVVPKEKVAFSQTTPDGSQFAVKYFNTFNFLTYIPN